MVSFHFTLAVFTATSTLEATAHSSSAVHLMSGGPRRRGSSPAAERRPDRAARARGQEPIPTSRGSFLGLYLAVLAAQQRNLAADVLPSGSPRSWPPQPSRLTPSNQRRAVAFTRVSSTTLSGSRCRRRGRRPHRGRRRSRASARHGRWCQCSSAGCDTTPSPSDRRPSPSSAPVTPSLAVPLRVWECHFAGTRA